MNITRIKNLLQNLFQEDSRWPHHQRRVVFWYDPDGQFVSIFEELEINDVKKIQLGDTPFTLKYRLFIEEPEQNFLLYAPFPPPEPQDNWLLDIEKSSLTFSADPAALIYADLGLRDRSLEETIRQYLKKFFNCKKRIGHLQSMAISPDTEEKGLLLAMLSVLVNLKVPDGNLLIREVLLKGLLESDNPIWQDIVRFVSAQAFWDVVEEYTGFSSNTPSLNKLFTHLLITHFSISLNTPSSRTLIKESPLTEKIADKIIKPGQRAYSFIDQWMRDDKHREGWQKLSEEISEQLQIFDLIENEPPEILYRSASFEVIDQVLIRSCVKTLRTAFAQISLPETVPLEVKSWKQWLKPRSELIWYSKYKYVYQALESAIALWEIQQQYPKGFESTPKPLFQEYTEKLYKFDQEYRHFILASTQSLGDIIKELMEDIDNFYTQWFLENLGSSWSNVLSKNSNWELRDIPPQQRFFRRYVLPILQRNNKERVFVIISDAFRYEVAKELVEIIQQKLRGEIQIEPVLGVLPSITRLGMAALLPGSKLELIPNSEDVLVDSMSTKSSKTRENVLNQNSSVQAKVIEAKELLTKNTENAKKIVQPNRLIYIYHNVIDAIGDQASSESHVFSACQTAIEDLLRLVKKICNSLNGKNVIITADHGFLYQRPGLEPRDKLVMPSDQCILEKTRRYLLTSKQLNDNTLQNFKLPYVQEEVFAAVPRGTLRFAVQGGGARFVHGGASLQEICVPVIYYQQKSAKGDEGLPRKVEVETIGTNKRVSNNRFTVRILQTEPVQGRWRPRKITVAMYDIQGNIQITDECTTNLDRTSQHIKEREMEIRLMITTSVPPTEGYLIIKDQEDQTELVKEKWRISLGIANDFGDF
ncbi:BREX-1 system phosphatase PglZ type A [Cylindrospermopsis sp. CR12]|uniref:BREX-1 system phosphatase PglZ type A n=1 Tax=Cylindrospermopsis sp. CR12 TaxID=1747196 RepID=UPI00070E4B1B|nr:BREX-1 system phosphatase PglZ type A [Cylindrospermopsis sp. CR12]KRH98271.1 alkaline phosphatase [Cylindrospermopsis sp. CR12]